MNKLKSTGVIRRIDELGRIVIPKEIRRHLGIREGENLEIFTEDEQIVLKKYSKMFAYADLSSKLCEYISSAMEYGVMITDRDKILSQSNQILENVCEQELNVKLLDFIQTRENYESYSLEKFSFGKIELQGFFYIQPIISAIDCLGLLIFVKKQAYTKEDKQFAKFLTYLIANKIDIS